MEKVQAQSLSEFQPALLQSLYRLRNLVKDSGRRVQKAIEGRIEPRIEESEEESSQSQYQLEIALFTENRREDSNSLDISPPPLPPEYSFASENLIPFSGNSNHYSLGFQDSDSHLASGTADDIILERGAGGFETRRFNPFTLERFCTSSEGLSGSPFGRSRSPSRNRTGWDDRSSEGLSGRPFGRSRSPSRSRTGWDDRSSEGLSGHLFRRSRSPSRSNRTRWDDRSPEGLSSHLFRRSRSPSRSSRTEWRDRSSEGSSGLPHRRSRSLSGRSSSEWDDREVPNPESERDSEESLGGEENEEEDSRGIIRPDMSTTTAACSFNPNNLVDWTARLNRSFPGIMGSTMGQETLGATALPLSPVATAAAAFPMNGALPIYPGTVLPGMPGVPTPTAFVDGQQNPSFTPDAIARALASTQGPRKPRGEKKPIPDEQRDSRYYERRKKNNEAAKKSRDARKMREDEAAKLTEMLANENACLREEIDRLRRQVLNLKYLEDIDDLLNRISEIEAKLRRYRAFYGF